MILCYNTVRCLNCTKSAVCWQPLSENAAVAQLDRVPDSDSGGRGFESRQPYQKVIDSSEIDDFFCFCDTIGTEWVGLPYTGVAM